MRGAIRNVIETHTAYKVCDEAENGLAAIAKATQFSCAMVLLDLSMPMLNGVEAASVLHRVLPGAKIVGFTMYAQELGEALFAASGFDLVLSKHEGLTILAAAIKRLLDPRNADHPTPPPAMPS